MTISQSVMVSIKKIVSSHSTSYQMNQISTFNMYIIGGYYENKCHSISLTIYINNNLQSRYVWTYNILLNTLHIAAVTVLRS